MKVAPVKSVTVARDVLVTAIATHLKCIAHIVKSISDRHYGIYFLTGSLITSIHSYCSVFG